MLIVDHISFKCGSRHSFECIRALFEASGANFWNATISGRGIAYIFLPESIKTSIGEIKFLELSDQKPDGSQEEGIDHVEVYLQDLFSSQNSVIKMLGELGYGEMIHTARPHHPTHDLIIDESGLELRLEQRPLIEDIAMVMVARIDSTI